MGSIPPVLLKPPLDKLNFSVPAYDQNKDVNEERDRVGLRRARSRDKKVFSQCRVICV